MDNIAQNLAKSNQSLPTSCNSPIMYVYCPKTYTSPKIKTEGLKQYQEMDGLIRWAVDLGAG